MVCQFYSQWNGKFVFEWQYSPLSSEYSQKWTKTRKKYLKLSFWISIIWEEGIKKTTLIKILVSHIKNILGQSKKFVLTFYKIKRLEFPAMTIIAWFRPAFESPRYLFLFLVMYDNLSIFKILEITRNYETSNVPNVTSINILAEYI